MELTPLKQLEKQPHQSFLRERYESLPREKVRKDVEQGIGSFAVFYYFGNDTRDIYDTSDPENRHPIENLWTPGTKYPEDSKTGPKKIYNSDPFSPEGQCGPTNLNAAHLLMMTDLVQFGKIKTIYWEEGKLWAAKNGQKTKVLGDHHAWFRVVAHDGREWRVDFTSYQYMSQNDDPDGNIRIVLQGVHHQTNTDLPGVNWRMFENKDSRPTVIPNAHTLYYETDPDLTVDLKEFDWTRGEGRPELLWGASISYSLGQEVLGGQRNGIKLDDLWYPEGFNIAKETEGINRRDEGEFKFKLPDISTEQAVEFVRQSSRGEIELSVEALGALLEKLTDQSGPETLLHWAADCTERALPGLERVVGGTFFQRVIDSLRPNSELLIPSEYNPAIRGLIKDFHDEEHKRNALEAIDHLSGAAFHAKLEGGESDLDQVRFFTRSAARSAGMAIDFSAFDRRAGPTPVSERHWQYLHLYKLMYPEPGG